jgi:hypothetical protein
MENGENVVMVICKEAEGKTIASLTMHEESPDGPEICIEFTDGTVFSACLKTATALEAKITRDDGGRPQLLKDYSMPAVAR